MARPVFRLRHPLVLPVRRRTVAKVLSIGFVTGMKILVPRFGPDSRIRVYGATMPIYTMSCELVLVAGRLCDSPAATGLEPVAPSVAAAESANP